MNKAYPKRAILWEAKNALPEWQQLRQLLPLSKLISLILEKTGAYACYAKQGEIVSENIDKLLNKLKSWEAIPYTASEDISSILELQFTEGSFNPNSENKETNSLHLMTIHASKGLEFPAVILCDIDQNFHFSSSDPYDQ